MSSIGGKSCIQNGILGLTPDNLTQYLQFVADMRLKQIGLPKKSFMRKIPFHGLMKSRKTP